MGVPAGSSQVLGKGSRVDPSKGRPVFRRRPFQVELGPEWLRKNPARPSSGSRVPSGIDDRSNVTVDATICFLLYRGPLCRETLDLNTGAPALPHPQIGVWACFGVWHVRLDLELVFVLFGLFWD